MYGSGGEVAPICPGEANCDIWASAKDDDHETKEKNVCHKCEMFPTKSEIGKQSRGNVESLVRGAFMIRNERKAGYPRPTYQMTTMDWQTTVMLEQLIEQEDINSRQQTSVAILAVLGIKQG
jgi:hypothetical protein